MVQKQKFVRDKTEFYFWTEGNEKNPPLVLLPGFTGTHGDLLEFARLFTKDNFVIIPDLPGWGDSPKGKYHLTIKGYATFLYDLLKSLSLDEKIFLAGHCMGSTIAIEFAYVYPEKVKQLFLIGVPYLEGTISSTMFAHLANFSVKVPKLFRPFFFFFRSRVFAVPLGFFVVKTRSLKKKLKIIVTNTLKQQFQDEETVEKNWNSLVLFDYKKLRDLHMPTHVFHGGKDILVRANQAEKLLTLCPTATFDIIPEAGHMPPVETPETLTRLLKKYLR